MFLSLVLGALNQSIVWKIAVFEWNLALSWKQYKICT